MTATDTNTPTPRRRRRRADVADAGAVDAGNGADAVNAAAAVADDDDDHDVAAAAKAQEAAELAKKMEKAQEIGGQISADMDVIAAKVKAGDIEVRNAWADAGDHLIEIRSLFERQKKGGEPGETSLDNKGFNKALVAAGVTDDKNEEGLIPNRNNRTHAMWLAELRRDCPEIFDMIEDSEEAKAGKSLGHPKAVKRWYDAKIDAVLGAASDAGLTGDDDDAWDDVDFGDNVAFVDSLTDDMADAMRDGLSNYIARASRQPKSQFKDLTTSAALAWICIKLAQHPDAEAIAGAISEGVEALDDAEGIAEKVDWVKIFADNS